MPKNKDTKSGILTYLAGNFLNTLNITFKSNGQYLYNIKPANVLTTKKLITNVLLRVSIFGYFLTARRAFSNIDSNLKVIQIILVIL